MAWIQHVLLGGAIVVALVVIVGILYLRIKHKNDNNYWEEF